MRGADQLTKTSDRDQNGSQKQSASGSSATVKKRRGRRKKVTKKNEEPQNHAQNHANTTEEPTLQDSNKLGSPAVSSSKSKETGSVDSCKTHPNRPLLSPTDTLELLRSKTFLKNFSNEVSTSSVLCENCSLRVACYFNVLQDTLQNVMADMLGLQKTHRCVECVQHNLQQTLANKTQGVQHTPTVHKVEQTELSEPTPEKQQAPTIEQEVTECPFVNKPVKSEQDKGEAYRPSNIGGNAISAADHNRCDPARCHIRRWYCSTPPSNVSPFKSASKVQQTSSTKPLIKSSPQQVTPSPEPSNSKQNESLGSAQNENVMEEVAHNSEDSTLTEEPIVTKEAYVTLATNDLYAMGCLILGHSIRLTGTSRSLVVVVSNRVSSSIRELLQNVFNVIYSISDHELKLVGDPDVGVSYNKLHVWKLTQFSKCVFLDCDMFMLKNCDELFERTEFSAVPDIRWPDCFNSGVFVFVPSDATFKQLMKTAQLPTIVDGGEQGLLNIHFAETWKSSLNCRLPFIYNLMANVSYTYIPAFKQFGNNAKIVHFLGSMKPWNIEWSPISGQLTPNVLASIHESYYPFVQNWLTLFIHYVVPCFSVQLQDMARKFSSMTVRNLMNMYEHFVGEESDHLPSNPSMRFRPDAQQKMKLSLGQFEWNENADEQISEDESYQVEALSSERDETTTKEESSETETKSEEEVTEKENDEVGLEENQENASESEIGPKLPDYNRMYLWEKGQMDYAGSDSTNNIMKKLDSLISGTKIK